MNKAEFIVGFDTLIKGLSIMRDAVAEDTIPSKTVDTVQDMTPAEQKAVAEVMNAPVETSEKDDVVVAIDVDALKTMKYNEFKKYASQLGVKCTGTRDEIMERILSLDTTATVEKVVEDAPVEQETKSDKPARSKRASKAEANEFTRDGFDEQAEEVAKETDVEDIISALADVDVKATKKNAVQKLAEALRAGLIELDDDDEDEDEEVEESESEEEEVEEDEDEEESDDSEDDEEDEDDEFNAQSYFSEYDPEGYNNPEEMTDERAESIEAKMEAILDAVDKESLTVEDITSYIEDNATEAEIDLLGDEPEDEECLKMYMELIKRTIDNDGEEHEPSDPYELGEHDMCCGHELKYVKKTKKYICEHCGTEYEAE